jgi:hypothetical protein
MGVICARRSAERSPGVNAKPTWCSSWDPNLGGLAALEVILDQHGIGAHSIAVERALTTRAGQHPRLILFDTTRSAVQEAPALRALRQVFPDRPLIVTSPDVAGARALQGFVAVLPWALIAKPYRLDALLERLAAVLASYGAPHVSLGDIVPVGQLNGFRAVPAALADEEYHWPAVANSAVATVMRSLFGLSRGPSMRIAGLESGLALYFQKSVDPAALARSMALGAAVGASVAWWSTDDGYASLDNCAYRAPTGPGLWTPTPPLLAPPAQPCWGRLRPFVLRGAFDVDPGPPLAYSEDPRSEFFRDAKEVYDTVNSLTTERRAIALFWADGPGTVTPAGHTAAVLRRITWERGVKLDVAAEAYAKVGLAAADAFISCWAVKYRYPVLRPVTYIRNVIDPTWSPLITTPPFPEYTSGHSMQSGATMQVLTDLFGRDFGFTDRTQESLGLGARTFASFRQAADEAALSRLYGGIHYRTADERGLAAGRQIGTRVNSVQFRR